MTCPRCRTETPLRAKFCPECGAGLSTGCAKCGAALTPAAKFCAECGEPVGGSPAPSPKFAAPVAYTPRHLADKILTSRESLEGERKQVTVLFADVKSSMELLADRDPEDARRLLDPVLERMMEAVHRYEGTVNQVMGDGIMALFGAPVAHEDHAVRACYAALRMQDTVKRYAEEIHRTLGVPVHIRVGLNSGEVVVRSIGSDLHMDYTAVGQSTHLAARMEQMAMPGTILATPETLRLVEGYVTVKPLGPRPVKGLDDPVEVYQVTGAAAARSRLHAAAARGLTRFVGRDGELEQLRQALERAHAGQGRLIAVVGEAGVGKSRLFWEFTHSHRTEGWRMLESGSVSYGKATAYLPLIDLFRAYFRIEDRDDARTIREKVSGKLLTLDETLVPALPAFLALLDTSVDDREWQALEPAQRRQRTLDGAKRLLLRESQVQPLLLAFEDLHWIDSETQAFLDSFVESLPTSRILLLVNYRPEYRHPWGGKSYYAQLRIDPLPPESAEALLEALVGSDPGLVALKRLLIERTDGNPFFLEESVRSLVETRTLTGEPGAYLLATTLPSIRMPLTVQAVLAARIDRLPAEEKDILQTAAVIGKDVPLALIQAVMAAPEEVIRRGLASLQASEFLYETRLFPDPEYTFKHALTLEVAYSSLLHERRRLLHRGVLETLEGAGKEGGGENVDLLAHHAVRGEVWERAARYLYLAGERAIAVAAYGHAATFYEAAADTIDRQGASGDLALKLDALLELWVTRIETGQVGALRDLAGRAEALALALNDRSRLAQVRVRQAQAQWWFWEGPREVAVERAREAGSLADAADVRTRSYVRFVAGAAYRDLGRIPEAIGELDAGIALLGATGPATEAPGLVLPIYVTLSVWRAECHAVLGDFRQGLASATDGLQMANRINHLPSVALADALLGYVRILRGEIDAALPPLETGLAIGEANGFIHAIVANGLHLGLALALLGRHEAGLSTLARATQAARSVGYEMTPWTRYGAVPARAYLAAGRLEEATAEIDQGLARAEAHDARGHEPTLLRLRAEVLARRGRGDPGDALQCCERSMALATSLGMRPELAHGHATLGRIHHGRGDRAKAAEHLRAAAGMFREMEMASGSRSVEAELEP